MSTMELQGNAKDTAAALILHANAAFGGTQAQGAYSAKDAYDVMELAVNQLILRNSDIYNSSYALPQQAIAAIEKLSAMIAMIPTQTRRDERCEAFQQFSTPPHLAYLVAWAASLRTTDVVLEPSAGIGGLAVFALAAQCKSVYVNELSERRSRLLSMFNFTERFSENAEQLNNILPDRVRPTVILANPPFSATAGRLEHKSRNVGCRHVDQAMLRLADGGRCVIILGDGSGTPEWWHELKQKYTVRASIGIHRDEYRKYGTSFPVRLTVIDKCGPTAFDPLRVDSVSVSEAVSWIAKSCRETRQEIQHAAPETASAKSTTSIPHAIRTKPQEAVVPPAPMGDSVSVGGVQTAADTIAISATEAEASAPMTDSVFEPYRPQRLHVDGAQPHPTPLVQSAAMASVLPPIPTYAPALPHHLIDTGALSEAQIEAVAYAGQAHRQFLPEVEIENPVTREKKLITPRRGYFCGDGTGLGKGRIGAAIIMDSFARGCRKAMWVTKNPKLLRDAIRDWVDLGGNKSDILNLSKIDVTTPIPTTGGSQVLFLTYALLRSGAKPRMNDPLDKKVSVKDFPDGVYADYCIRSIVRACNKAGRYEWECVRDYTVHSGDFDGLRLSQAVRHIDPAWDDDEPSKKVIRQALGLPVDPPKAEPAGEKSRLRQVAEWAGPSFDGVIWYDEAHCMKSALEM